MMVARLNSFQPCSSGVLGRSCGHFDFGRLPVGTASITVRTEWHWHLRFPPPADVQVDTSYLYRKLFRANVGGLDIRLTITQDPFLEALSD